MLIPKLLFMKRKLEKKDMELYASLSTISLILILFFLIFLFFKKKVGNHLPGSSGWPIFGESLEFLYTGSKGYPQKFILDRISKYSSNSFKTHLFGSPAVVLCGASNNKFLFSNENKLVKVWLPSSVKKVFLMPEESTTDEKAANLRKWLRKILKGEETKRFIRTMDIFAQQHFQSAWVNNDSVLVLPLTKDYTFSIACRVFMSIEDPTHVAKFSTPFNLILKGIFSIPVDLPGTPLNQAKKAATSIRKEIMAIVKQRKVDLAEGSASPTQDILSHMLLTSDIHGNFTNEGGIVDDILGLLVGGHDTVNALSSTVVMLLAEFPNIYERVFTEQMEIASKKAPGEFLNFDDLNGMKYSWNVACEAMRIVPPVQGGFREAITDFTHNGFRIPKGWKMYWSSHSTNRDPAIFPEPEKFDPSRFEGSGPAPYTYVPFGVGPRMCPGNEYSRFVVLVFVHNLVKRFKWEKVIPNEKMVVNPMPNPENGLPVRLFPHKAC